MDKVFGYRCSAIIFASFLVIGQLMFATAVQFEYFYFAVFSRFIYGIGMDLTLVVQSSFASRYFSGKYINRIFGLHASTRGLVIK